MLERAAILVAGCGNVMAGGDAFGPLVVRRVAGLVPAVGVEVVDLSMNPSELVEKLEGRRGVILVDAVVSPEHVEGELLDLDCSDVGRLPLVVERARGSHDFGLAWQLKLAASLGVMPAMARLIALVIREAKVGEAAPAVVGERVVAAGEMVRGWWEQWSVASGQ